LGDILPSHFLAFAAEIGNEHKQRSHSGKVIASALSFYDDF